MRAVLTDLDLSPQGATVIDLHGRETAENWSCFGSSYGSSVKDWTAEKGIAARDLAAATEKLLKKASRQELVAFINEHGGRVMLREKKRALVTYALLLINEVRYPREFINAAPNEYKCACGYCGPREVGLHKQTSCPACGKPGYLMVLSALIKKP